MSLLVRRIMGLGLAVAPLAIALTIGLSAAVGAPLTADQAARAAKVGYDGAKAAIEAANLRYRSNNPAAQVLERHGWEQYVATSISNGMLSLTAGLAPDAVDEMVELVASEAARAGAPTRAIKTARLRFRGQFQPNAPSGDSALTTNRARLAIRDAVINAKAEAEAELLTYGGQNDPMLARIGAYRSLAKALQVALTYAGNSPEKAGEITRLFIADAFEMDAPQEAIAEAVAAAARMASNPAMARAIGQAGGVAPPLTPSPTPTPTSTPPLAGPPLECPPVQLPRSPSVASPGGKAVQPVNPDCYAGGRPRPGQALAIADPPRPPPRLTAWLTTRRILKPDDTPWIVFGVFGVATIVILEDDDEDPVSP